MRTDFDALAVLRDMRPDQAEFEPDEARLERILATPAPPVRRSRRRARLALAGVAAAVVAAAGVALGPFVGGSADVVARAAAALNDPGTILHFEIREAGHTLQLWQTAGGNQKRVLYDEGFEYVEDSDAQTAQSYVAERDQLVDHGDVRVPVGLDSPNAGGGIDVTDNLAQLLERGRRGEDGVRLVGETTIRGIPAYELRIEYPYPIVVGSPRTDPERREVETRMVKASRTVYVDRERFLPLRVVENVPDFPPLVAEYLVAERLPRTPENERLLRMSPHPGAEQVREGTR